MILFGADWAGLKTKRDLPYYVLAMYFKTIYNNHSILWAANVLVCRSYDYFTTLADIHSRAGFSFLETCLFTFFTDWAGLKTKRDLTLQKINLQNNKVAMSPIK